MAVKLTKAQERKLARERLKSMPLWFRAMIKDLKLKPETLTFSMSTPTIMHSNGGRPVLEHTGEVNITIHGFR